MKKIALGLMSGTSADGVSAVICEFDQKRIKLLAYKTTPYSNALRDRILGARELKTPEISQLNMELGAIFGKAARNIIESSSISRKKIAVIGSHGQTVYHGPSDQVPNTLQIGEPSVIAEMTGISVVADFRPRDIAAGGEGAPLIPFFDHFFFGQPGTALQNIGGISNITYVGKNRSQSFDNGPGNCLMDWAVRHVTANRKTFDRNGDMARRGFIDLTAIREMSAHPYFKKSPPKSTGPELFSKNFIPKSLLKKNPETMIATLTFFTALMIHKSCRQFIHDPIKKLIISGGGALNTVLMSHLKKLFNPIPVKSISSFGFHPQAKEAIAFAFMGLRAIEGKTNHCPAGTGAKHSRILGKIIPA